MTKKWLATLVFFLSWCGAHMSHAQNWPSSAVTLIVGFAPGGSTDIAARVLAEQVGKKLGQNVVVVNRPGAAGVVGANAVAIAKPDGQTFLFGSGSLASAPSLNKSLPFDVASDFLPVTQITTIASILAVHPSVPARSVKEFVDLAKKTRGGLNFGSNGTGTTSHLALVMFNQMAGTTLTHIPYKGAGALMTSLLSGEVEVGFPAVISVQSHLRSGRLRALAVTTKRRSSVLPDVPPLDAIYAGFDIDNWFALFAPAGTPPAIINRIHTEVVKGLQHAESKAFMANEGAEPVASTPAEFAAFVAREIDKYAQMVKLSGAKPD